jgi:phage-related tail fiber protein
MKDFLKENWFKVGIIIAILLLAYSVYYALVVRPDKQATEQQQLKTENQNLLQTCLALADLNYSSNWATACQTNAQRVKDGYQNCVNQDLGAANCRSVWGTPDDSANCSLPTTTAQNVNNYHDQDKADCYKQYPTN